MEPNKILRAAKFAATCHKTQKRDYPLVGTPIAVPYIYHVARVAGMVATLIPEADEDDVSAAWCHDLYEDCQVTYNEVHNSFGRVVANLTMGLTSYTKRPGNEHLLKLPREERIKLNNEWTAKEPLRVRKIKICDRIDNLTDTLIYSTAKRALRYADETEQLINIAFKDVDKELYYRLYNLVDEIRKKYGRETK